MAAKESWGKMNRRKFILTSIASMTGSIIFPSISLSKTKVADSYLEESYRISKLPGLFRSIEFIQDDLPFESSPLYSLAGPLIVSNGPKKRSCIVYPDETGVLVPTFEVATHVTVDFDKARALAAKPLRSRHSKFLQRGHLDDLENNMAAIASDVMLKTEDDVFLELLHSTGIKSPYMCNGTASILKKIKEIGKSMTNPTCLVPSFDFIEFANQKVVFKYGCLNDAGTRVPVAEVGNVKCYLSHGKSRAYILFDAANIIVPIKKKDMSLKADVFNLLRKGFVYCEEIGMITPVQNVIHLMKV